MRKIMIIGRHRSGTTWLANTLASHHKIYTPSHKAHRGQHESEFFSSVVPYCRHGKTITDRLAIRAIFERSDFWHLLFPEEAPSIDIESLGVHGYFAAALNTAATLRGFTHWLEKTPAHTLLLGDLLEAYPDATFVAVVRNRLDTTRSNVYRFGNPQHVKDWFKVSVWNEIYIKIIGRYLNRVHIVRYEDLEQNFDEEIERILRLIGLEYSSSLRSDCAPNTSFDKEGRAPDVARKHQFIVKVVAILFRFVPSLACEIFAQSRVLKLNKPLPHWFFRVFSGKQ